MFTFCLFKIVGMNVKKLFFAILFLSVMMVAKAARVDTLSVQSMSMNKQVEVIVVSPEKEGTYPVLYLLHGYSGNAKTWLGIRPELTEISDREGIIFVCPDGKNSWYWDSPVDRSMRYETFVSKELVSFIDGRYPTRAKREGRAVTGLSMGGHGAMWLALRHKDVFGAAGSMSGGLDIRPFPENWEMKKQLGNMAENQDRWNSYTAINQIDRIKDGDLALIIDCGYDDFFLQVNQDFHQKLLANKIGHDFILRPGAHTEKYWNNAIDYQILFFKKFFENVQK